MTPTVTSTAPETMTEAGPNITDAFVADRQAFWGSFTHFVTRAVIGLVVLLILMAYFLV